MAQVKCPGLVTLDGHLKGRNTHTQLKDFLNSVRHEGHSGTATRDIPVYLDMLTHVGAESAPITNNEHI